MANKQIYELSNVGNNLDNSALVAVDIPNPDTSSASEIPYVTRKMSVAAMEQQVLNDEEYTTELNTENQTIFGSINEVLTYAKNIADEYDDTATYSVGDFCTYMGVLYKCIVAIAVAESWDATHWDSTLIVEEFGQGGGGASVTLGTTTPSDASGSNGDLYVQYDGVSYAAVYAYVKINGSWRKFPYNKTIALTQAEYEQITPENGVYYIITDAQSSYQTKQDSNLQTTADTIVGAINEVNSKLSEITLNSNPATGDYHFDLAAGWSVTNFVFNRVGNRIYMQGVFVKTSAFTSYETFISLSSSSTKIISPYYETWFATMCDDGNGSYVSCERLQAVYGSLRISSSNSNHRRIFVCASWISSSDVV